TPGGATIFAQTARVRLTIMSRDSAMRHIAVKTLRFAELVIQITKTSHSTLSSTGLVPSTSGPVTRILSTSAPLSVQRLDQKAIRIPIVRETAIVQPAFAVDTRIF